MDSEAERLRLLRESLKIDESSYEARIASINKISKEFRPLGKVVAITHSPNILKE